MSKIYTLPLIYCLAWVVFFIQGMASLDPDFGWHLRMGEIILTSGIPKSDPFSYTMPGYPFIDHEWLNDVITFKVYDFTGLAGLSIFYATVVVLTLLLVVPKKLKFWAIIPLILSSALLINFAGVRPQLMSLLLTALLLKVTLDDRLWKKWRLLLPLMFLFWANIHGGFITGLGIIFVIIVIKTLKERRIAFPDFSVFIASFLVTLINPYGVNLWKEILKTFSDTSLRSQVAEWVPIFYYFDIAFLLLLAISLVLVIKNYKSLDLKYLSLYIILLLMGLSSVRNIPFWVLINIPVVAFCFDRFSKDSQKKPSLQKRFNISIKILLMIATLVGIFQITSSIQADFQYPEERIFPAKAISFLKNHPGQGEIFAPYDWGGYIIWKYPDSKVFVDGRMPSWKWNPPSTSESGNAYKEYRDIIFKGGNFNQTFNKYNVHTVLWSVMSYLEPKKPKSFTQRLEEAGWKKIYVDEVAVIYEK